jgi:hypothetical protein
MWREVSGLALAPLWDPLVRTEKPGAKPGGKETQRAKARRLFSTAVVTKARTFLDLMAVCVLRPRVVCLCVCVCHIVCVLQARASPLCLVPGALGLTDNARQANDQAADADGRWRSDLFDIIDRELLRAATARTEKGTGDEEGKRGVSLVNPLCHL